VLRSILGNYYLFSKQVNSKKRLRKPMQTWDWIPPLVSRWKHHQRLTYHIFSECCDSRGGTAGEILPCPLGLMFLAHHLYWQVNVFFSPSSFPQTSLCSKQEQEYTKYSYMFLCKHNTNKARTLLYFLLCSAQKLWCHFWVSSLMSFILFCNAVSDTVLLTTNGRMFDCLSGFPT